MECTRVDIFARICPVGLIEPIDEVTGHAWCVDLDHLDLELVQPRLTSYPVPLSAPASRSLLFLLLRSTPPS